MEQERVPQTSDDFDRKSATDLFYGDTTEEDKIKALDMADPYYGKDDDATMIVMNAAAGRGVELHGEAEKYAKELLYKHIEMYIYYYIHQHYNTYVSKGNTDANREMTQEMLHEAVAEIYANIGKYDVSKGAPTTFLKSHIQCGINRCLQHQTDMTESYYKNTSRVTKAESKLQAKGEKVTPEAIKELLPNMSLSQIADAFAVRTASKNKVPIDTEAAKSVSDEFDTPEHRYLVQERSDTLYRAIENLPEEEKTVFALAYGVDLNNHEINWDGSGDTCKDGKLIDISNRLGIKPERVSALKASAVRRLRTAIAGNGYGSGRAAAMNYHDEAVLNQGRVVFREENDDDLVAGYIDSIIEIRVI